MGQIWDIFLDFCPNPLYDFFMGTIEERISNNDGNITYRAKVRIKGAPAQSATFSRKTDAKRWIQKTETDIREGRHLRQAKSQRNTVSDVIERYLSILQQDNPKRAKDVIRLLNWWKNEIGYYYLSDLNKDIFIKARQNLQKQNRERPSSKTKKQALSNSTINRYWVAMQTALNIAVKEWEWLAKNPMASISKLKEPEGRKRFLSDKEREALLKACKNSSNPYLYTIVIVALSTGARRSEILNLTWSQVDFKRNSIYLLKTKNKESRALYLHNQALDCLKTLKPKDHNENDLVFKSLKAANKPYEIKKSWEAALREAEIKDFRFHDLRHSAASYLAMNGATLAEIAEVLGHKTLAMVKRYSHLSESHTSSVVKNMNDKIFGES